MNANQIINMVVRMVMRKAVNGGMKAGIDAVSNKMAKGKAEKTSAPDPAEAQKRMRQSMRVTRKLGKF